MQAPPPLGKQQQPELEAARRLIESVLATGRTLLTTAESKSLLAYFHIPIARPLPARSEDEAAARAAELGFPVAMKVDSPDITHKTEVGGVHLQLTDPESVRSSFREIMERARHMQPAAVIHGVTVEPMIERPHARELLIGVVCDRVFGPAITFGTGGITVEVHADRAVGLPPLNHFLARQMIGATRAARMLGRFRGMPPVDREAVESVLLAVSAMVCELPSLRELDINPLLADEAGVIALDARVVVGDAPAGLRLYAHMAIHPYPAHLQSIWRAADGTQVIIRPIWPEDAAIEGEFVVGLSPDTKYLRFMAPLKELSPAMLARFTQVDYDREMALIATIDDSGRERQIAVCRYFINADGTSCEFAIVVTERWQGRGLGRHLMLRLIEIARDLGIRRMTGDILAANIGMLDLVRRLGFKMADVAGVPSVKQATLDLA
jgi:acetyltransferase